MYHTAFMYFICSMLLTSWNSVFLETSN